MCEEYVFFVKQKTEYEMLRSLVGSEMCIRDSTRLPGYLAAAGMGMQMLVLQGWSTVLSQGGWGQVESQHTE